MSKTKTIEKKPWTSGFCGPGKLDWQHEACKGAAGDLVCVCSCHDAPTPVACPAALNIAGEHFPCQQMEQMAPGSANHDGWAHSNRDAQAIWVSDRDPVPGMPGVSA